MSHNITINLDNCTIPLKHFWSGSIGAGRAAEGLRAEWQRQLKMTIKDCGFRYIRFHGLLCDEMGVYHLENGVETYHFAYVDFLFDGLLEAGIRPIVEFGFMPQDLASGCATQFWWKANVTPPKDYDSWARLLTALITHWMERYGRDEVFNWYFEIWNEPDLHAFWAGTKSQYFKLYEISVKAIKSIHSRLRVGGPATSNFVPDERFDGEKEDYSKHKTHTVEDLQTLDWKGVWLEDFLSFLTSRNLPLDFLSTHPYPTDFALDGQEESDESRTMRGRSRYLYSTHDDLTWIRRQLADSAYPDAEIHLTEWSSSPTSRDYSHDYLPAAAYIVKCCVDCIGLADSLSYWVFTDIFEEAGPGPEAFHGGFGLLTMHGIKKPSYHAYTFLNRLGCQLLNKGEDYIATKDDFGRMRCLFYHYPEEMEFAVPIAEYPNYTKAEEIQKVGSEKTLHLSFCGLAPGARITCKTLDSSHGSVTALWKAYGYPKNLTREQAAKFRAYSDNLDTDIFFADENGWFDLDLTLEPWSIVSIDAD